jgi:hypothetical protein
MSLGRRLGVLEGARPAPVDLEARRSRRGMMKEALDDVARLRREGRDMGAHPRLRALAEALERRRAGGGGR